MNERDLIVDILAASRDDESHPEFVRVAMENLGINSYINHSMIVGEIEKLEAEFKAAFDGRTLKDYYYKQSAQSLIECFDGFCCHKYR